MDGGRGSSSTSSNGGASASASTSVSKKKMKYVCVTGGVVSGLGKGKRRREKRVATCGIHPSHALSLPSLHGLLSLM
jgi:hypothetical protein